MVVPLQLALFWHQNCLSYTLSCLHLCPPNLGYERWTHGIVATPFRELLDVGVQFVSRHTWGPQVRACTTCAQYCRFLYRSDTRRIPLPFIPFRRTPISLHRFIPFLRPLKSYTYGFPQSPISGGAPRVRGRVLEACLDWPHTVLLLWLK